METKNQEFFKQQENLDKKPMIELMKNQDEFRDIFFR